MGIFSKANKYSAAQDATYAETGHYIAKMVEVKEVEAGDGTPSVVWEFELIKYTQPPKLPQLPFKPGTLLSDFIKSSVRPFIPRTKAFMVNIMGCEDKEITEEHLNELISEKENPSQGAVIEIIGTGKPSKDKKNADGTPIIYTRTSYIRALDPDEFLEEGLTEEEIEVHGLGEGNFYEAYEEPEPAPKKRRKVAKKKATRDEEIPF